MKYKVKLRIWFAIVIQIILFSLILSSCGLIEGIAANRYFRELSASYTYDSESQVLKKLASEIEIDEKNEFMIFDGKNAKPLTYETVNVQLRENISINITYTVHNGKLIIAEVPIIASNRYEYFMIDGSTDKFIAEDRAGSYLVNLSDLSAMPFMSLGGFQPYEADIKLFSISPDGKYMLYYARHSESRGANIKEFYLCAYDISSNTPYSLIGFENTADLSDWEFLCWEKGNSGSFLYREKYIDIYGIERHSNIYRYSIASQTSNVFLEIDAKYSNYEMVDDEHIYAHSYKSSHMNGVLYIKNIYTREEKAVVLPRYAITWQMSLSENKEYAALCSLYIDMNGHQVTRLVTVNLETNDIRFYYELGYEPGLESYDMHSFYWYPDNILAVNFVNIVNLYNDICRFHRVNHIKSNIPSGNLEEIILQDTMSYEEE